MATSHYCPNSPKPDSDGWQPGSSDNCPHHGSKLTTLAKVRMSGRDRAKADRAAGVIGQDRGDYING